nr:G2/mitotic-specific cyclin S13-7-like [Tanacetum cinerariifolium]
TSVKKQIMEVNANMDLALKKRPKSLSSVVSARRKVAWGITTKPKDNVLANIDESDINNELDEVEYVEEIYAFDKDLESEGENGSQSSETINDNFSRFKIISNPLFDEFYGPSIPIHILEEERTRREHADYINQMEMLLTINPHPHNPTNDNTNVESFSSFQNQNQENKPRQEEIDVVSEIDDVLPPSNDDSDDEVDNRDLRVDNVIQYSEHEIITQSLKISYVGYCPGFQDPSSRRSIMTSNESVAVHRQPIMSQAERRKRRALDDSGARLTRHLHGLRHSDITLDMRKIKYGIVQRFWKSTSLFESDIQTNAKMADNHTMAQMLQAHIEGYEDAIVVPPINANNFELKQTLINLVQSNQFTGRQDPHNHLRLFNKVTSTYRHPEVPKRQSNYYYFLSLWKERQESGLIKNLRDLS